MPRAVRSLPSSASLVRSTRAASTLAPVSLSNVRPGCVRPLSCADPRPVSVLANNPPCTDIRPAHPHPPITHRAIFARPRTKPTDRGVVEDALARRAGGDLQVARGAPKEALDRADPRREEGLYVPVPRPARRRTKADPSGSVLRRVRPPWTPRADPSPGQRRQDVRRRPRRDCRRRRPLWHRALVRSVPGPTPSRCSHAQN